jgi:hypothetical protein
MLQAVLAVTAGRVPGRSWSHSTNLVMLRCFRGRSPGKPRSTHGSTFCDFRSIPWITSEDRLFEAAALAKDSRVGAVRANAFLLGNTHGSVGLDQSLFVHIRCAD